MVCKCLRVDLCVACVLRSVRASGEVEAQLFEGIFSSSFFSPSSLIDMLLLCGIPKDHMQASSVRTESSVGLEKSTDPLGTISSVTSRWAASLAGQNLCTADAASTRHHVPTKCARPTILERAWKAPS